MRLPHAPVVAHEQVIAMVKHRRLARRGIGWVDAHLLGSALAARAGDLVGGQGSRVRRDRPGRGVSIAAECLQALAEKNAALGAQSD